MGQSNVLVPLNSVREVPLLLVAQNVVLTIYLCQETYDPIWSIKSLKSVIREDTLCLSYDWDDKKNTIFFHSSSAFPVPPLLQPQIKPANHSSFWWCNLRIPFHLPPFSSPLNQAQEDINRGVWIEFKVYRSMHYIHLVSTRKPKWLLCSFHLHSPVM